MAFRRYLMPMIVLATPMGDAKLPKYASIFEGSVHSAMDYGAEPACLVSIEDPPDSVHDALVQNADVVALPRDLSQTVGAQLGNVQSVIKALGIPTDWISGSHTYAQVLRTVGNIFQFAQRLDSLGIGRLVTSAAVLDTKFSSLSAATRTRLQNAADSLGYSKAGLTANATIGEILKSMADQRGMLELRVGNDVI